MTQDSHDEKRRKHMAVMDDKKEQAMTAPELKRYTVITEVSPRGAFYGDMAERMTGEYVRYTDVEAYTQAAIAAAMMGAVKPLVEAGRKMADRLEDDGCSDLIVAWDDAIAGIDEDIGKFHAALSIPTDATAALNATKQQVQDDKRNTEDFEDKLAKAVEDAFCEGFAEGCDGTWVEGDYTHAWKKSHALANLEKAK